MSNGPKTEKPVLDKPVKTLTERTMEVAQRNQTDETFNLIAKSLLNVSDQVPNMVRDMAELKVSLLELKHMMESINNSLSYFRQDIENIARATGAIPGVLNLAPQPRRSQQAPGAPTPEQLREAMRAIPGVDKI
jgi:methyl-accepting chemotaxis protein